MGKHRQVPRRTGWEANDGEGDKLQGGTHIYYTRILISRPAVRRTRVSFTIGDRGPIRSEVLNPFISRAMMHDPLPSERIKGALDWTARRWNAIAPRPASPMKINSHVRRLDYADVSIFAACVTFRNFARNLLFARALARSTVSPRNESKNANIVRPKLVSKIFHTLCTCTLNRTKKFPHHFANNHVKF